MINRSNEIMVSEHHRNAFEINSHSGDLIAIQNYNGTSYIKKTYKRFDDRTLKSINKQKKFEKIINSDVAISAVDIIDTKISNDQYSIIMPYVNGISGEGYSIHGDREMGQLLSKSINQLIINNLQKSKIEIISATIFIEKIKDINFLLRNKELLKISKKIELDLIHGNSEYRMPIGLCHGDLTLSNIILCRHHGVKLIDFLHTYLESPLQDVAKVIQDYRYGWSFRFLPDPLKVKGAIFLKNSMPDVIDLCLTQYKREIEILTKLTLLRIAPYVKDCETEKWLITSLNECVLQKD